LFKIKICPVNGIDVVLSGTFRLGLDGRHRLFVSGNGHISICGSVTLLTGRLKELLWYAVPAEVMLSALVVELVLEVAVLLEVLVETLVQIKVTVQSETVKVTAVDTLKASTEYYST
jgi:hypothetical protein